MFFRASIASRLLVLTSLAASGPIGAQTAPHLIAVDTAGSDTSAFALPSTPLIVPVTQVRLRFDLPLAAVSAAAFRVVEAGIDGARDTLACLPEAVGDDVSIVIGAVHWDDALREATLQLDAPQGLPRGRYRVLACDTLLGLTGMPLDGDGDGLPGGIAHADFEVQETSVLANPGFDEEIGPWWTLPLSLDDTLPERVAADADSAPASGALRVATSTGRLLQSAQCLPLHTLVQSRTPRWDLHLRYRVLAGRARVVATFFTGFAGDMGDAPCIGPAVWDEVSFFASASDEFATYRSGWRGFAWGFPHGALQLSVIALDGRPLDILFDDIGLRLDSRMIFRDDFD